VPRTPPEHRYLEWVKAHHGDPPGRWLLAGSSVAAAPLPIAPNDPELIAASLEENPWGHPRLLAALGAYLGVPEGDVIACAGGSVALMTALMAGLARRRRAVVELPCYQPFWAAPARLSDGPIRPWARREGDLSLSLDALEPLLDDSVGAVLISNPHNPSGDACDGDTLRALEARVAARSPDALIVVDEVYRDILAPAPPAAASLGPRFVSVGGLTKVQDLGWLRCGWIAGGQRARLREAHALNQNIGSPWLEAWAALAFERGHCRRRAAAARARVATNLGALRAALAPLGDAVEDPAAAPRSCTRFLRLRWLAGRPRATSTAEVAALAVAVGAGPGRFFGAPAGLRGGLGAPPEAFAPAAAALAAAIAARIDGPDPA